jgi:hypothetical protein
MTFYKTNLELTMKPPEWAENQPAWLRLEDQVLWYDRKSQYAQRWYKWLKLVQVILAISIPILSQIDNAGKWLASVAGGLREHLGSGLLYCHLTSLPRLFIEMSLKRTIIKANH